MTVTWQSVLHPDFRVLGLGSTHTCPFLSQDVLIYNKADFPGFAITARLPLCHIYLSPFTKDN